MNRFRSSGLRAISEYAVEPGNELCRRHYKEGIVHKGALKQVIFKGCDGGIEVSVLAFYSDDPSSNPAGYLTFLYKKTKIN